MKKTLSKKHQLKYYDIILGLFVAVLIISNIGAVKLVEVGGFLTDGGVILFPLAYIFGDILTEVYGFKLARRAIWTGFFTLALAIMTFNIVRVLPAADAFEFQQDFENIFGFFPRIVIASLLAYLFGEYVNSTILAKMKLRFKGKQLWRRLIGSTLLGQGVDTVIFGMVAFGGILTGSEMIEFVVVGVALKVAVEVLLLPVSYRVISWLKNREGLDVYDSKTDFTLI